MKKVGLIAISLMIAIEIFVWYTEVAPSQYMMPQSAESLWDTVPCTVSGYKINGREFAPEREDPQLYFATENLQIGAIDVEFSEPLSDDTWIQVYYAETGQDLAENHSVKTMIEAGKDYAIFKLPKKQYSQIRIDIDGSFSLQDVAYSSSLPQIQRNGAKILAEITVTIVAFGVLALFYTTERKNEMGRYERHSGQVLSQLSKNEYFFLCLIFLTYFAWAAIFVDSAYGPDEMMRYDIPRFIYQTGTLPYGWEESIRNPYWGVSYGFSISLPYLISAVFMKVTSLFTTDETMLLIAARFTSVLSMTAVGYYAIKISKEFRLKQERWIFICLLTLTPQSVFLASYVNLDSFSLLTALMITYSWIRCIKNDWDIMACVYLGVSTGLCFLSYKFAYGFILSSVVLYCAWYITQRQAVRFKRFIVNGTLIIAVAFLISGWCFIRNAIIYDGDFLALHASRPYAELYAVAEQKPSLKGTFQNQGYSVLYMLKETQWIESTLKSAVSMLGYMSISASNWVYMMYEFLCVGGLVGVMLKTTEMLRRRFLKHRNELYIVVSMAVAGAVTIAISVYYSWASDYQPQGRYVITALPAVWWVVMRGIGYMAEKIALNCAGDAIATKKVVAIVVCFAIMLTGVESFIHCLQVFVY